MDNETLINEFRTDLAIKTVSIGTQQQYPRFVQRFADFIGGDLISVDVDALTRYLVHLKERNIRKSSITKYFNGISMFYDFLVVRKKLIPTNSVPSMRRYYLRHYKDNAPGQDRQCLTVDQAKTLIQNILDPRDRVVIFVLLTIGIRSHELTELNLADVDIPNRTIILHETAKRTNRTVYFTDETAYVLKKWLVRREKENVKHLPALFVDRYGGRLSGVSTNRIVKKYGEIVGFHDPHSDRHDLRHRLTPHCLRHSFTSWLLNTKMNPKFVQYLRGDAGRESQDAYNRPDKELVKAEYDAYMPRLL